MNDKDLQFIERYFSFDLDEAALNAFVERMQKDEAFAKQVLDFHASQKQVQALYESEEETNRKNEWNQLFEADLEQVTKPRQIKLWWLAAAAIVLIGLFVGLLQADFNGTPTIDSVLAEAESLTPTLPFNDTRGTNAVQAEKLFYDAYALFKAKEYKAAVTLLAQVPEASELYTDAQFLKGVSHYNASDLAETLWAFEKAEPHASTEQQAQIIWYRALILLRQGNIEVAKTELRKITDKNLPYHTEAEKLLQQTYQLHALE